MSAFRSFGGLDDSLSISGITVADVWKKAFAGCSLSSPKPWSTVSSEARASKHPL